MYIHNYLPSTYPFPYQLTQENNLTSYCHKSKHQANMEENFISFPEGKRNIRLQLLLYDSEFSKPLTFKNLIYICICQPPPGKSGNKHLRDSKHLPCPQKIFESSYISTINYHSCKMNHSIVHCYMLSRTSAQEIKYNDMVERGEIS